jgi:hypothetical protein
VVEYFGNCEGPTYLVENVDTEGSTVWLAEFSPQELVADAS